MNIHDLDSLDSSLYPSRSFIRFSARNQLIADLTGQRFPMIVKRLGEDSYVQEISPSEQSKAEQSSSKINPGDIGLSLDFFSSSPPETQGAGGNDAGESLKDECNPTNDDEANTVDEHLLGEICATTFNPKRNPALYVPAPSKRITLMIEQSLVAEIVETYKEIKLKQKSVIVQQLNALL